MQDKYVGDIGDYFKYSLLRRLKKGKLLGVFWYLFPDELNGDGSFIGYLEKPDKWRHLDPELFDALKSLKETNHRNVASITQSHVLDGALFSAELDYGEFLSSCDRIARSIWDGNAGHRVAITAWSWGYADGGETWGAGSIARAGTILERAL
jgi:hypothetical protein